LTEYRNEQSELGDTKYRNFVNERDNMKLQTHTKLNKVKKEALDEKYKREEKHNATLELIAA
jgi:hypothetical protein